MKEEDVALLNNGGKMSPSIYKCLLMYKLRKQSSEAEMEISQSSIKGLKYQPLYCMTERYMLGQYCVC